MDETPLRTAKDIFDRMATKLRDQTLMPHGIAALIGAAERVFRCFEHDIRNLQGIVQAAEDSSRLNELRRELAETRRAELEAEVLRLRILIDRDRTGLARGLDEILKEVRGYAWLAEKDNWGPYSYEEHTPETLRREFEDALRAITTEATNALRNSGVRADSAFRGGPQLSLPLPLEAPPP